MKRGEAKKAMKAVTSLHEQLDKTCKVYDGRNAKEIVHILMTLEDARILRQAFEEAQTTSGVLVSIPSA